MPDDYFTTPRAAAKPPRTARTMLIVALLAFLGGAVLVGWLASRHQLDFVFGGKKDAALAVSGRPAEPSAVPSFSVAQPLAAASDSTGAKADTPALPADSDQRMVLLEERLNRLDLQAEAASGNAARAEGLLIAFAARRMIARGSPLGYLEDQLKLRFADAQPNAVQIIIDSAKQPVTLDQLSGQLDALSPKLVNAPEQESGWSQMKRQLSNLFVIRKDNLPSADPVIHIERAKLLLGTGKIDEAIDEVGRMPGAAGAQDWIGAARRYAQTQSALDLIETTAMLEPSRLKDAAGAKVKQPSPLVGPAA